MGTFAFWRIPVAIFLFGFISQVGFAQSPTAPVSATPVRDPQAIAVVQSAITGRVANPSARHRFSVLARLKPAGVPNPSRCEGFGF
jgi:hypothetical protein